MFHDFMKIHQVGGNMKDDALLMPRTIDVPWLTVFNITTYVYVIEQILSNQAHHTVNISDKDRIAASVRSVHGSELTSCKSDPSFVVFEDYECTYDPNYVVKLEVQPSQPCLSLQGLSLWAIHCLSHLSLKSSA
jgi:hypothetical protein